MPLQSVERLDFENNVMAACTFECDDLYERGYLAVGDDANVVTSPVSTDPKSSLGRRLGELRGRRCAAFSAGSSTYFAWHHSHIFRTEPPALG